MALGEIHAAGDTTEMALARARPLKSHHSRALLPQSLISPPAPICAPMSQDRSPLCRYCRKPMKLHRTIPNLEALPPIDIFHCVSCSHTTTKQEKSSPRASGSGQPVLASRKMKGAMKQEPRR